MTVRELNTEIRKIRSCIMVLDEKINQAEIENKGTVTIADEMAETISMTLEAYIRMLEDREVK